MHNGIHSGTGAELDRMTDAELIDVIEHVDVCCRVSPQHKTRIVDALKAKDHVVAMTGDGVNGAPALALGLEKGEPDIMQRPPRPSKEPVIVLITVYVPFLRPFFGTEFLGAMDWLCVIHFMLMAPIAAEIVKIFLRRRIQH